MNEPEDNPGLPIAPPLLFVIPLAALLGLEYLWPTSLRMASGRVALGIVLVAIGLLWVIAGAVAQRSAGTEFIPDRPTTAIVKRGPYRISRNPMYVGFAYLTAGIAVVADSWWAVAAILVGAILIDRIVIVREERYLERKFGDEYRSYKRRVRRWL